MVSPAGGLSKFLQSFVRQMIARVIRNGMDGNFFPKQALLDVIKQNIRRLVWAETQQLESVYYSPEQCLRVLDKVHTSFLVLSGSK